MALRTERDRTDIKVVTIPSDQELSEDRAEEAPSVTQLVPEVTVGGLGRV